MLTFSAILCLLRSRLRSKKQKRPSSFYSTHTLKRSHFHSFSSSRSSSPLSPHACSPLPGRPLDVVIHNLHTDAWGTARAARPIAVETLLAHMLAVIARRYIHLHSVAATPFSITLVIDDPLEMMTMIMVNDQGPPSCDLPAAPANNSQTASPSKPADKLNPSFRLLVSELVNTVEGVHLRDTDFLCEENQRNRILGQRRKHEW